MKNLLLGMALKAIRADSLFLIDDVYESPELVLECSDVYCAVGVDIVEDTLPTWRLVGRRVSDIRTDSPFTAYIGGHVIQTADEYHKTDIPGDFIDALLLNFDDGKRVFIAAQQGAEEPQVVLLFDHERINSRLLYYSQVS